MSGWPSRGVTTGTNDDFGGHQCAVGHLQGRADLDALVLKDVSRPAARRAAHAFRAYRQRGGTKTGVLPDFFIGAHAQAEGYQLLTRDAGRYQTYFPNIKLICP